MREGLESAGYQVIEAGTAREAVQMLADPGGLAVALLDVRLPDSDDLALLRRFRRDAPACRVIMMTAHGTPELLSEALSEGAFGAVLKPFDMGGMIDLVRAAGSAA